MNRGHEKPSLFKKNGKENQNSGDDQGDREEVINVCVTVEVKAREFDDKLGTWEIRGVKGDSNGTST